MAVNTWEVFPSDLNIDPHPLYRALYGAGNQKMILDGNFEPIELTYEEKTVIPKSSGKPVATDVYERKEFRCLSAVLWSAANAGNPPESLGDDFRIARNGKAVNSIPEEFQELLEKRRHSR